VSVNLSVVLAILRGYLGIKTPGRNAAMPLVPAPENRNLAMTTFDKREEGFEKKFAIDEELKFKADARRNKLLGLWVAEKLGLSGEAANAYAKEVVAADFDAAGGAARKVAADLAAKGVAPTEAELGTKINELMAEAIAQVKAGK
jgi:hypothetical protein